MRGGRTAMARTQRKGPAIVLGAAALLLACNADHSGSGTMKPQVESNTPPPESPPDQQAGGDFFDDTRMHEVRLFMSDDDFTSILQDSRGDDMRKPTFSIYGVLMANVGVRPAGESSRVPGNQKMSMRVEFDAFEMHKKMGGV